MKKTFFLLFIFLTLAGSLYFFRFNSSPATTQVLPANESSPTNTSAKQIGLPVNLTVPSLGISTEIESVGLDSKRNMDVPKEAANVGWYNLGPRPGEAGSAVMAGHLDDPSGNPAVFWDLKKIKIGEKIEVTDENGEKHTFTVTSVKTYPWNDFPLQEVFADSSGTKLNLITCGGEFDKNSKNYSERTVVYAEIAN